jgi:hypothetical protein
MAAAACAFTGGVVPGESVVLCLHLQPYCLLPNSFRVLASRRHWQAGAQGTARLRQAGRQAATLTAMAC